MKADTRPYLLLDVDGVLNLLKMKGKNRVKFDTRVKTKLDGQKFVYDEDDRTSFKRLQSLYRIVWASKGWEGREDEFLAPLFGLPTGLPKIKIPDTALQVQQKAVRSMHIDKIEAIEKFVGTTPFALIDDRMGDAVRAWADTLPQPHLLLQPDPTRGITEADVWVLESWPKQLGVSAAR